MFPKRPGRIRGFNYLGLHRYSLTICAFQRKEIFTSQKIVAPVLGKIRDCAGDDSFEIIAYCFMPDHLHLLVRGLAESADLQRFMWRWKQFSGFAHKRATGESLWQESYFDHVLRDDEETWRAAKYILENPVRRGLVSHFAEYPYCGSDVFSAEQLTDLWQRQG